MRSMPQAAQMPFLYASAPQAGKFIAANIDDIHGTLFCGLGGSLDVFAGVSRRAPDIFIKLGLEWFYRLLKQPEPYRPHDEAAEIPARCHR